MEASTVGRAQCVHHWIIDTPGGTTSQGRCKRCGAVAEFFNELRAKRQPVVARPRAASPGSLDLTEVTPDL